MISLEIVNKQVKYNRLEFILCSSLCVEQEIILIFFQQSAIFDSNYILLSQLFLTSIKVQEIPRNKRDPYTHNALQSNMQDPKRMTYIVGHNY